MTPLLSSFEGVGDEELVRRFNAGEARAFDEIVRRYRDKMHLLALQSVRNRADAEEIASEVFVRAHRGLKNFRGDSSLHTWLYRITVNLSKNHYWYFWRRKRHMAVSLDRPFSESNDATIADVLPSDEAGPAGVLNLEELSTVIEQHMEELQPDHREILTLCGVLHLSYEEIAQIVGINVGTVKSRIARARANLRSRIAAAHPEFSTEESA